MEILSSDLPILLSYGLQNDIFREILTSARHSIAPTNEHPEIEAFSRSWAVEDYEKEMYSLVNEVPLIELIKMQAVF